MRCRVRTCHLLQARDSYTGAVTMTTGTSSAVVLEKAEQSDADVIRQVLDGDTALFELLMRRYSEQSVRRLSPFDRSPL